MTTHQAFWPPPGSPINFVLCCPARASLPSTQPCAGRMAFARQGMLPSLHSTASTLKRRPTRLAPGPRGDQGRTSPPVSRSSAGSGAFAFIAPCYINIEVSYHQGNKPPPGPNVPASPGQVNPAVLADLSCLSAFGIDVMTEVDNV